MIDLVIDCLCCCWLIGASSSVAISRPIKQTIHQSTYGALTFLLPIDYYFAVFKYQRVYGNCCIISTILLSFAKLLLPRLSI